jgi:hypothetical protein
VKTILESTNKVVKLDYLTMYCQACTEHSYLFRGYNYLKDKNPAGHWGQNINVDDTLWDKKDIKVDSIILGNKAKNIVGY